MAEDPTEGSPRLDQTARPLRQAYAAGQAEMCGVWHHNLAADLLTEGAPVEAVIAHMAAAGTLLHITNSPHLEQVLANLTRLPPLDDPPDHDAVAFVVEQTAGVEYAALIAEHCPAQESAERQTAAFWELAQRRWSRRRDDWANVPASIREAIHSGDRPTLLRALEKLDPRETERVLTLLHSAGLVDEEALETLRSLRALATLMQAIAHAAVDESLPRDDIEKVLLDLEQSGWQLRPVVARIWQGERSRGQLVQALPEHEQRLVGRILDLIAAREGE